MRLAVRLLGAKPLRTLDHRASSKVSVRLFCTSPNVSENTPSAHAADNIMQMSSNKATRFVFMRTLPLVKQPELESDVDLIASSIETSTRRLCEKHAETVTDDRSAVHLHTTALAIATHRVLSPRIRNEIRLSNIIRAGFGAVPIEDPALPEEERRKRRASEKQRPDFWIVRAALWFSLDRMAAIRKMTANMVRDFGSTFETESRDEHADGLQSHQLVVKKCYYNEICRQEGLPHLTKIFCALDKAIYSPITVASHGIEFDLGKTLADDNDDGSSPPSCNFTFVKRE